MVNIDLETRTIKEKLTSFNIIRVGTSGSLQKEIPVDSFVASTHGLGLDNLLNFYLHNNNEEEKQILHAFNTHTQLHQGISAPYINGASMALLKEFVNNFHQGITVTCPGFYGPQGRVLRMGLKHPHLVGLPALVLASTISAILKWKHPQFMVWGKYWAIIVYL